jgi:hypothetical protein
MHICYQKDKKSRLSVLFTIWLQPTLNTLPKPSFKPLEELKCRNPKLIQLNFDNDTCRLFGTVADF